MRARGPRSVSQAIDIETESIERAGEVIGIRSGVRLTVSEAVAAEEVPGGFGELTSAAKTGIEEPSTAALKRCATQSPSARSLSTQNPNVRNPGTVIASSPCFSYGTRLRVRAKLHRARNYRNPGAFDYQGYLRDNEIAALGSAHATDVEPLPGFVGSRVERLRMRIHASIVAKIHDAYGRNGSRRSRVSRDRNPD
jgi:hypothetical protein